MGHQIQLRCLRRMARQSRTCHRSAVKRQALKDVRSEAEEMLQEMAFVFQVTRSMMNAMIEERASSADLTLCGKGTASDTLSTY